MRTRLWLLLALALGVAVSPGVAQAARLRGFGEIHTERLGNGQGMKFNCDSPAHATLLIHKLARDMSLSSTVSSQWVDVPLANRSVPVLVRPGLGAYLVLAQGSTAYCFTAPREAGVEAAPLARAFSVAALLVPGAELYDAAYVYPA